MDKFLRVWSLKTKQAHDSAQLAEPINCVATSGSAVVAGLNSGSIQFKSFRLA
jgi:hypothetical protein